MRREELIEQLRALGVRPGGVLLTHTSFRATRPVEGGPLGLIEALRAALGPKGTLTMPSWTGDDDSPFDPRTTPAAADLGVVADTFYAGRVVRSPHPLRSPPPARTRSGSPPGRCRCRRTFPRAPWDECMRSTARFCSWA